MTARRSRSSGAGATRTSSPRPARSGRPPRASASTRFGARRCRAPVSLEESSCRRRGCGAARRARRDLLERRVRARHARLRQGLPRHRARRSAAASTTRPTWSRGRADEAESRRLLDWCAVGGRGRDPVRRRHQRRGRRRAARRRALRGRRLDRPARARPGARGGPGLARGAHPGRRARAGARGPAARPTGSPCATSRSRSSSRRSAAGSPRARAATSPRCYTHIDDFVESVRAVTPRGVWESRRLPGSGAGPSPDRMLLGSEGTLGRDHRGVDARCRRGRASAPRPACTSRASPRARRAVRELVAVGA